MRSWRKQIIFLLTLTLAAVLVFLGWLAFTFSGQYSAMLRQENESDLTLWMSMAEQRLNAVHDHVYEILLTVYTKATTVSGSGSLPVSVAVECQEMMENLLLVSTDTDCFFLTDTESGFDLICAQNTQPYLRTIALKEFVRSLDPAEARSTSDRHWTPCTAGGETYFLCCLRVGKFNAGALCRANTFSDVGQANLFSDGTSLYLALSDGSAHVIHGQADPGSRPAGPRTAADFPLLGCQAVMTWKNPPLLSRWGISVLLFLTGVLLFSLVALLTLLILRKVADPTQKLLHAQEQIAAGNLDYRITAKAGSSEFNTLYHSFNDMADQIRTLRIASYDNLLKEEENKFRMVRAQIKPHFYLNSITVLHNMTYQNRLEDIRSYIQALAKHIRYMLNIQSPMISVSAELAHIENYIRMQDLRFPGSVKASYRCDEAVAGTEIPFLMLFTVVENSFKHAMNLYSTMELNIVCEPYSGEDFRGMRMTVEDNGDGYSPEVLAHFSGPMPDDLPTKDHLGLSNVQYTLRYVYRRDGLLRLSNLAHGARTEILIPGEVKKGETADL